MDTTQRQILGGLGVTLLTIGVVLVFRPQGVLQGIGWVLIVLGPLIVFHALWPNTFPAFRMPVYSALPIVYNEGHWWLVLERRTGENRRAVVRCEVRDPWGEVHRKELNESVRTLLWYPAQFGQHRPLRDGEYEVRWKVFPITERQLRAVRQNKKARRWVFRPHTVARGDFEVRGDAEEMARLRNVLDGLEQEGGALLDQLPPADWDSYSYAGRAWVDALHSALSYTVHFEPGDAGGGIFFFDEPETDPEASARRTIHYHLDKLAQVKARFE